MKPTLHGLIRKCVLVAVCTILLAVLSFDELRANPLPIAAVGERLQKLAPRDSIRSDEMHLIAMQAASWHGSPTTRLMVSSLDGSDPYRQLSAIRLDPNGPNRATSEEAFTASSFDAGPDPLKRVTSVLATIALGLFFFVRKMT